VAASRHLGNSRVIAELARWAEGSGYSTVTFGDHPSFDRGDPIVSMTIAATATSTLRVSSYVLSNDYRHPAVMARQMATLDEFSAGRVEIGVGAGWLETDYAALGLPFDPPDARLSRLEESLQLLRAFFSKTTVSHSGSHYQIADYPGYISTYQHPYPPLLAGGGGKRVLSVAARHANIVALNENLRAGSQYLKSPWLSSSTMSATLRNVEIVRDAAGPRFENIELNILVQKVVLTSDPSNAAQKLAHDLSTTEAEILKSPRYLLGDHHRIVDLVSERRAETGISYLVVPADDAEAFAPVVQILEGQ
jgi:probable F420-dependent oxidoreductase